MEGHIEPEIAEARMNLKDIKDLIELVDDKGFAEFEIKRQGFRLRISRFKEATPQIMSPPASQTIISSSVPITPQVLPAGSQRGLIEAQASAVSGADDSEAIESGAAQPDLHVIKSPIVGTFYSAPSPTSAPFARIGDHIDQDTVVCIIEAMKLMNEIQAEVSGDIVKIYVENGQPVEYGQALFGVKLG
jgi:acetyl-CoA carboxylase biotin carboxyl carrier protein